MKSLFDMKTKQLFCVLALMTAGLFISCSEDTPDVSQSDDFKLEFNEEGNLMLRNFRPISQSDFNSLMGSTWKEYYTREVLPDGSISPKDYWEGRLGGGSDSYEFSDGKAINYFWSDVYGLLGQHWDHDMRYDESTGKLYFDDQSAFIILSINKDEITTIKRDGVSSTDNGDQNRTFLYEKLRRLSSDEETELKRECWSDYNAMCRSMIPEDLCRKWVLWDGISNVTEEMRRDDSRYIRFLLDGTIEGVYDGTPFKGTYAYKLDQRGGNKIENFGSIRITPAEGSAWPGEFLSLRKAYEFEIEGTSFLDIRVDAYQNMCRFVSGIDGE